VRSSVKMPSAIQVISAIGKVTFFEIMRDRVLYNILLCSVLLLSAEWVASQLAAIHPERVVLDFGLSSISISGVAMGLLIGAGLLSRDMRNRTFHMAICRPITKTQFILGKFTGISCVLFLNWFILSFIYLILLSAFGLDGITYLIGADAQGISAYSTLFIAIGFCFMQSLLVASWSILISTFSTTSVSVVLVLGIYLVGSNISQLKLVAARLESPLGRQFLPVIATLLPNFEYFQLGTKVTYGLPLATAYVLQTIFYGGLMLCLTLMLAGILVRNREG